MADVLDVAPDENPGRCVEIYDPAVDYFPDKVEPRFAERFAVDYHEHYKLVTVTLPGGKAFRYLLVLCGTPRPAGYDDAVALEIPVRTFVTISCSDS